MAGEMTPIERVMAGFNRKDFDRARVINPTSVANTDCMRMASACFPEVHTNADKMAALAAAGHEILGFDTIAPYFSILQEAAALGCDMDWGRADSMPAIKINPVKQLDKFKVPKDFLRRKPVKTVLDAIKMLKKKYKGKVPIIGKVMGPWTLSYHLHGVHNFLLKTILEPDAVTEFLYTLKQVSVDFANAQFEAGADIITWADHSTGDLISPKGYEKYLLPIHKEVNKELKKSGPVILHICGYVMDRVHYLPDTGFEAFHFDSRNNPRKMMDIVSNKMLLTGCINNPKVLLSGTTQDVKQQVYEILDAGVRLVSPECAVPCGVPNKNLIAIVDAVKEYCRTHNIHR